MTAVIRMYKAGDPSVLVAEDEDVGHPGTGQVKLHHEAIGVNFVDTMFRSGAFGAPLPFVTGVEASGIVTEVGAGDIQFKVGDRVAYFFAPGAYAAERLIDVCCAHQASRRYCHRHRGWFPDKGHSSLARSPSPSQGQSGRYDPSSGRHGRRRLNCHALGKSPWRDRYRSRVDSQASRTGARSRSRACLR